MVKKYSESNAKLFQKERKGKKYINKKNMKLVKKVSKNYRKYLITFIKTLQEDRKLKSKATINSYSLDIIQFLNFLNYKNKQLNEITSKDIEKFKKFLLNKKRLKVKTVNRKLTSVNQFLKINDMDIYIKQLVEQKQNYLNNVLSKEEVERILYCCKNNIRDRAIINTLYLTGVRVSELLQLTVQDVNSEKVTIRGKGEKYRNLIVTKKTREVLNDYLKVRGYSSSNKLFIGKKGPLKRQSINRIIKEYAVAAKVKKSKAHPHNFRHVFCKNLADSGVGIDTIAELAGHSDLNTTRIYTKKTKEELEDIVNNM